MSVVADAMPIGNRMTYRGYSLVELDNGWWRVVGQSNQEPSLVELKAYIDKMEKGRMDLNRGDSDLEAELGDRSKAKDADTSRSDRIKRDITQCEQEMRRYPNGSPKWNVLRDELRSMKSALYETEKSQARDAAPSSKSIFANYGPPYSKGSQVSNPPTSKYDANAVQKEINRDPRIKGKEAAAIHVLLRGRDSATYDENLASDVPADREPNQSDLDAAARGLGMNGKSPGDLDALANQYAGNSMFAAKVIYRAAKQIAAAKRRMGARDGGRWGGRARDGAADETIYAALRSKLGREPTNAELKAEVDRIKSDGVRKAAEAGKLRHQR